MVNASLIKQNYIRAEAVDYIQHWLGLPYFWGGDDPIAGFDCSGIIIEVLQTHGLIDRGDDYTAEGLRQKYSSYVVSEPYAGCLVFFINTQNRASHVAMCMDRSFIIHASGGSRNVKSLKEAIEKNAYIKKDSLDAEIKRREKHKVIYIDPFRSIGE
jgi:cell wall-associated NlpC family hydrolase